MNTIPEQNNNTTDPATSPVEFKQSPPAFLDLADSRVELKRMEHERQRLMQRQIFEDQMRALEQQQAHELLTLPYDPSANGVAVSAPTTPPRITTEPPASIPLSAQSSTDSDVLFKAVGSVASKRKSVAYAPTASLSPEATLAPSQSEGFSRSAGAKSMPASRRASASEHDDELANHLQNLRLVGERSQRTSPAPLTAPQSAVPRGSGRFGDGALSSGGAFNATVSMFDEQLDQEMHNAMKNLPMSDDDKYAGAFGGRRISVSSAALDLAHMSQTSPRSSYANTPGIREKASEWPSFGAVGNGHSSLASTNEFRRSSTGPSLALKSSIVEFGNGLGKVAPGTVSASNTPIVAQHPQSTNVHAPGSRRPSPPTMDKTRSVPATPLGTGHHAASHLITNPGTPRTPDAGRLAQGGLALGDGSAINPSDLQASLSRLPGGQYDGSTPLSSFETGMDNQFGVDSIYGGSLDSQIPMFQQSRYGPGSSPQPNGNVSKMNGPYQGTKKPRGGDVDREFNRFTGTRLEDLQGEIAGLCKDQHGCRYLQKKLEEGVPEHRDMIFRETFGHFAELMTDPFGNYLCQKLLEYSTDDQRNVICDSVAQDLVNISLNMHGTRAVQKMVDFLSIRRLQGDVRYQSQIHSIIVALSLHVVVLIKDLNGNHVIQKCLNKLAAEDNQFIYNAVAANCVEVATHRHGCCVLQRCIDHASERQRVQLVNEITYNALTLVQDPYGNYVVQYILDLNDSRFSDGVIRQFSGNVCALSVQKFSSNVIEKCIRVAEHSTRKMLIDELLNRTRLEKLLRDSYGNYCVQTALDYAEPAQRTLLVEGIRPVLPLIRNTPYGKRIQNKLQREHLEGGFGGGGGYRGHGGHHGGHHGLTNGYQSHSNGYMNGHQAMPQGGTYGATNAALYGLANANLYGQAAGFGASHMPSPQMHGLQAIDPYTQALTSSHSSNSGSDGGLASYNSYANGFGGAGLADTYQRTASYTYSM